jgi:hypothetical protein
MFDIPGNYLVAVPGEEKRPLCWYRTPFFRKDHILYRS